jgi:hypothetical protein
MEAVDVLVETDRIEHRRLVDVRRQWQLHKQTMEARIGIQTLDLFDQLSLRHRFGQFNQFEEDANFLGSSFLQTNVALRVLACANLI